MVWFHRGGPLTTGYEPKSNFIQAQRGGTQGIPPACTPLIAASFLLEYWRWLLLHRAIWTASIMCLLYLIVRGTFYFFGFYLEKDNGFLFLGCSIVYTSPWQSTIQTFILLCGISSPALPSQLFHVTSMTKLGLRTLQIMRSLARPFSTHFLVDGLIILSLTNTSWFLFVFDDTMPLLVQEALQQFSFDRICWTLFCSNKIALWVVLDKDGFHILDLPFWLKLFRLSARLLWTLRG